MRPVRRFWLVVEGLEPRIVPAGGAFRLPVLPPASVPFHVVRRAGRAAGAAEMGGLFRVPGQPGQLVAVRFAYTLRDAAFRNELGMFLVDDAQGHIGRLKPGDPGYAAAALSRARGLVLFSPGQAPGASRTLELPAGQFFGLYLIQNSTTARFLTHNPRNRPGRGPVAFFSLVRANPDRFQHLRGLPGLGFGFEDGLGGGDRDFNDLVTRVEFGTPQGMAAPPPGPPSPITAPSPAPAKPRIPPSLTARLSDDTAPGGTTNADGLTSDPAVAGTVT
ncbi:MAG TPA: DUF4114 domain-containing protein, partial [Gemmataceae bacterium]|nr:DUF4114 domain-containing protein [Gemmataceae bacterium]